MMQCDAIGWAQVAFNAGTGVLLLVHWLVRRGRIQRLTAERDRLRAMLGYLDDTDGAA